MDDQEKAAELEATKEVKEEEVRAAVIAEFGFDEVDDAERIDKAVKKEVESRKKLSAAIGQKIKHRTEAETLKNDPRLKTPVTPPPTEAKLPEVDIDKKLDEKLAERDLSKLDVSDAIRKEVKDWAAFKGISIEQAAKAPHIASQIADYQKEQKAEEAAINRTNRSGGKKDYSLDAPPKVDMSTAEGQKEYDEWKTWAVKNGG